MNRKKRLQRGIESLKEQIKIHEKKKKLAEEADLPELARYYDKEIASKEEAMNRKKKIVEN